MLIAKDCRFQWFPSKFKATVAFEAETEEEVEFPSAEHWMMLQKALLFSDFTIAREVMAIKGTSKTELAQVKALGRRVDDFTDKKLRRKLLATGDKVFAEASPRDKIWGIGFGDKNAIARQQSWGLNLLGEALVEARRLLREELAAAAT
ncbi:hypothetical protein C8J56DRAFT_1000562 [Mycena floridula]|nr:hypothetical protein C8J56DRAFT_1000562 [Mycena floridula]